MEIFRETGDEYAINDTEFLVGVAVANEKYKSPEIFAFNSNLTCEHAEVLAEAIKKGRHLLQAEFHFTKQEPGAFLIILKALHHCDSLLWLKIDSRNHEGPHSPLTANDLNEMAKIIKSSEQLNWVSFVSDNLPAEAFTPLFQACRDSKSLQRLYINNSKLGIEHMPAFVDMLTHNASIKELWVQNNMLDHQCISVIAKAMSSNPRLKIEELQLAMNDIDSIAMSHLAMFLSHKKFPNCPLRKLDVGGCELKGVGGLLGDLLANNRSIIELKINCNFLEQNDLKQIAHGVQKNNTIQKIDISMQPFYVTHQLAPDPNISKSPKPIQVLMDAMKKKLAENQAAASGDTKNDIHKSTL